MSDKAETAVSATEPMTEPLPDEEMCPNCVTPWKCNGPHVPERTVAAPSSTEDKSTDYRAPLTPQRSAPASGAATVADDARTMVLKGAKKRQQNCAHGNERDIRLCCSCCLDEAAALLSSTEDKSTDYRAPLTPQRSAPASEAKPYVDRGEAVNLARNALADEHLMGRVSRTGIRTLCEAVMRMDAALLALPSARAGMSPEMRAVLREKMITQPRGTFYECAACRATWWKDSLPFGREQHRIDCWLAQMAGVGRKGAA